MCATFNKQHYAKYRCSNRDVFLGKVAMKICSKFTGFDKKANVICKIYLINWETNNCNTHSAQYVKK